MRSLAPAGSGGYLLEALAAYVQWGHVRSFAPAGSGGYLLESLAAHLRWGHVQSLAPAGSGGYLLDSLAAHLLWGHVRSLAPAGSGGYLLESLAAHLRWGHVQSLAPAGSGGYLLESLAAHLRWGHVTCGHLLQRAVAVTCWSHWRRTCGGVTCGHLLQRAVAVTCWIHLHLRWGHVRSLAPAGSGGCLLESFAATCGALAVGSRAVTCSSGQWRLLLDSLAAHLRWGHERSLAPACKGGRLRQVAALMLESKPLQPS